MGKIEFYGRMTELFKYFTKFNYVNKFTYVKPEIPANFRVSFNKIACKAFDSCVAVFYVRNYF